MSSISIRSTFSRMILTSALLGMGLGFAAQAAPSTAASPSPKPAAPHTKSAAAKAAPAVYECPDCHEKFTEAQAKKDGMKCTCCQTKLVKIKSQPTPKSKGSKG